MNYDFTKPTTVGQLWNLVDSIKLLQPPTHAKCYINRSGDFHISWKTPEESARELASVKLLALRSKQRNVLRLENELTQAKEELDAYITED